MTDRPLTHGLVWARLALDSAADAARLAASVAGEARQSDLDAALAHIATARRLLRTAAPDAGRNPENTP